jgi:hypothetical protein
MRIQFSDAYYQSSSSGNECKTIIIVVHAEIEFLKILETVKDKDFTPSPLHF